jgi:AcrR family transcriptional regulator
MLDLPTATLIGGTLNFLSMRLTENPSATTLLGELAEWTSAFQRSGSSARWAARFLPPAPRRTPSPGKGPSSCASHGPLRERILYATMLTVRERGYRASTVADIVAAARVSRRHFYNEFTGKPAAFIAAYEMGFQRTLAVCAPAFFSAGEWPERVWNAAQAFTGFLAGEPLIAHIGFVERYAVGREYVPRLHDTQLAFTLFLEEGFRQRPEAESLSRSCAEVTAAAIFELAFNASRYGPGEYLRRIQPLAVYIALAPFLGRRKAGEFVAHQLASVR